MSAAVVPQDGPRESAKRDGFAEEAAYQVEGMLQALHAAACESRDTLPFLVQSMAVRLHELNSVMMIVIRGDKCEDAELESMLVGGLAKP